MMSLESKDANILTTDKAGTEAIAGTMNDVKIKIMDKMGLKQGMSMTMKILLNNPT